MQCEFMFWRACVILTSKKPGVHKGGQPLRTKRGVPRTIRSADSYRRIQVLPRHLPWSGYYQRNGPRPFQTFAGTWCRIRKLGRVQLRKANLSSSVVRVCWSKESCGAKSRRGRGERRRRVQTTKIKRRGSKQTSVLGERGQEQLESCAQRFA